MPSIEIVREGERATLRPPGDVVASSVGELRLAMRDLVREGVRELVLDLTHVGMLDSTGIGLLLSGHNSLAQSGGKLAVVEASGDVLELLRTMRVHQHFEISGRRP